MTATVQADIRTDTLSYDIDGTEHRGYIAYDDSLEGPRPGVLVIHEWWGLNDYARHRARDLAAMGYVAFAADMYGGGRTTEDPAEAGEWSKAAGPELRRLAGAGLEQLAGHDRVDTDRLAAIGFCFGGTSVLQLAYSGAELDGVVSFHGNLPVPGDNDIINAAILVQHGAADPLVPTADADAWQQAMGDRSSVDWHFVAHGGAKHAFTNPAADDLGMDAVGYDAAAADRSWAHMQRFFDELFAR
ncbi:MAG: dienelactone hydrolase family protein [Salinisphaeraceae bacterium]